MKLDEIEKPGSSFENMVSPFNTGISFQGFPSNLFMVNAIRNTPTLTKNQVLHKGFMEETSIKDHGNSSVVQVWVSPIILAQYAMITYLLFYLPLHYVLYSLPMMN
jgi:hypothetical protein